MFSGMYRPWRLGNVVMEEESTDEVSLQEKYAFLVLNMRHCSTELHTHTRTREHTHAHTHTRTYLQQRNSISNSAIHLLLQD